MPATTVSAPTGVGPLLSEYRKRNRLSQMELSLLADVSSRHISFIETGRSKPSRDMLLRLADVMSLPHRDSNLLLHSGGFAPAYTELNLHSEGLRPVREALDLILSNHNPLPAVVMDGNWNLLMSNEAHEALMSRLYGGAKLPTQNVLEAIFLPGGIREQIVNWDEVAGYLLRRLRKQVLAFDKAEHRELYEKLLQMEPPLNWQQPRDESNDGPMLTVDFRMGDATLSIFSTLSQFGTALDAGAEELIIESYFPANEHCQALFNALLN